jgi:hypothetical protein
LPEAQAPALLPLKARSRRVDASPVELRAADADKARARRFELSALDIFIGLMAIAVLASFFLPWFTAAYEPHHYESLYCFDGAPSQGSCSQTWNAWQAISPAWALPLLTFALVPEALLRVLGEKDQTEGRDWLLLAGTLLAVAVLGIVFVPDLHALNRTQESQAALYGAQPWVYTSVSYASGLFATIGLATAGVVGSYIRIRRFPRLEPTRHANFALISLTAVAAVIGMSFVGDIVTRF